MIIWTNVTSINLIKKGGGEERGPINFNYVFFNLTFNIVSIQHLINTKYWDILLSWIPHSKSETDAPSRVSRLPPECPGFVICSHLPLWPLYPKLTPAAPQLCSNKLSPCPWDHSSWGTLSGPLCVALCVKVTSSDASPTQSPSHPSLNYPHGSYLISLSPSTVCLIPSQKNSSGRAGASCPPAVQCQAHRSHLINKYL